MPYGGDPANSDTDAVRSLLADTSTGPALSDNEIQWLVDQHPNVYFAAAAGADMLAASKSVAAARTQVGDLSVTVGGGFGPASQYRALAKQLRRQAVYKGVQPAAGGISISDKETAEADTDWDRPDIRIGVHDWNTDSTGGTW